MIVNTYLRKYNVNTAKAAKFFSTMAKFVVKNVSYIILNPEEYCNDIAKGLIEVKKFDEKGKYLYKYLIEKTYTTIAGEEGIL